MPYPAPLANSSKWIKLVLAAVAAIAFVVGGVALMHSRMNQRLEARLRYLSDRRAEVTRQANLAQPAVAAAAADPNAAAPEIEQLLLSKCGVDPKFCHFTGMTYEHDKALANALHFYEKSCEFNYGPGCASLASLYTRGEAVPKSAARALEFYTKSCEFKAPEGCLTLGKLYLDGRSDTSAVERARVTFEKSCSLQNGEACYELGKLYRSVSNAPATNVLARASFERGCRLNNSPACKALDFPPTAALH